MIPRRRIALEGADWKDWLRSPLVSSEAALGQIRTFEAAFAAKIGVAHAFAVTSGRDALLLILEGLGVQPGDELIIPAYTLGELVPLMQGLGLRLVPADIDPETFNLTPESVQDRLTPRTRGILALHVFGAPCDMDGLTQIAREAGIALIEDCAHAAGASLGTRMAGSLGTGAIFSLEVSKALPTFGGGMLATSDTALAERIGNRLRQRQRREWPALKKTALKSAEELLVRSPLYAPAARILFSEAVSGWFDSAYRSAHDRVRTTDAGFSAYQSRLGLRRLAQLETRNAFLNRAWHELASRLPTRFRPQMRSRHGQPAFYNFVALFDGDIRLLRQRALARGLDLGIGGEITDDTAAMLGFTDCPHAARVHGHAFQVPLYAGLPEAKLERITELLRQLADELP